MQDEILGKAATSDTSAVPRYQIVDSNGTVVAANATIMLMNPVEQEGTPINTATLLSQNTAQLFKNTIPATVNEALALLATGQGKSFDGQISVEAWSAGLASITIPIDTGNQDTDSLVLVIPVTSTSNMNVWSSAEVKCYQNIGTTLKFKAKSTPTSTVYFTGVVFAL